MSCYYCERNLSDIGGTRKTKDHVVPITRGGVNHATNIVICCHDCNSWKGSATLQQFIKKVERARKLSKKNRRANFSVEQLWKIVKNTKSLIENCINVYQKRLFIDKYHYEDYLEKTNTKEHTQ